MAIAFVNSTSLSQAASSASIVAPAIATNTGNMIVVGVRCGTNNNPTITVTDTAGNTYAATRARSDYVVQGSYQMFYAKSIVGNAANVVTVAFAPAVTARSVIVLQYSGADLTAPLDVSPVSTTGNGSTMTSNTVTTTVANGLLVAMAQNSMGGNFSAGTYAGIAMTQRVQVSNADFGAEDLITTATHSTTCTYIYSVAADFIFGQAAFIAATVIPTPGRSGGLNNLADLNNLTLRTIPL